jgi:hypothetical protein
MRLYLFEAREDLLCLRAAAPVDPLCLPYQAHESSYLLVKARRLHDATLELSHAPAAQAAVPPAYLAQRVGAGGAAPEVGVRGLSPATRRAGSRELRVEEAVVRHWVEGMRGELVRELVEL